MPGSKSPRRRALGPGCSLLDWIRLSRSGKDLAGTGGEKRVVTEAELAKHNTLDDAWTAIRGKVYNITPYMKFHPGGKEDLMKGAGKDCTILFDEAHKGVNVESMLAKCLVGTLAPPSPATQRKNSQSIAKRHFSLGSRAATLGTLTVPATERGYTHRQGAHSTGTKHFNFDNIRDELQAASACEEEDGQRQQSPESPIKPLLQEPPATTPVAEEKTEEADGDSSTILTLPAVPSRRNSDASRPNPRFDWVQSERTVVLHIQTQMTTVKPSDVVLDVQGRCFDGTVYLNDWVYNLNIALAHPVTSSQVAVNGSRVDITFHKETPHEEWETLGSFLPNHGMLITKNAREPRFREGTIESIQSVSHDSKLFTVRLPEASFMLIPTGHHVSIKANIRGEEVERSYTPVVPLSQKQAPSDGRTIKFMIKLYCDGQMSQYLSQLKVADHIQIGDPEGTFNSSRLSSTRHVLLIAAGTGFTPMAKVIRDLLSCELDDQEPRSTTLLFANKREQDILWKEELQKLNKTAKGFEVVHILSQGGNSWNGLKGRVDATTLKTHLPCAPCHSERDKTLVCICGPNQFTAGISNLLMDLEYPDDCIHCFT